MKIYSSITQPEDIVNKRYVDYNAVNVSYNGTIPNSGWGTENGIYYYQVSISGMTSKLYPLVWIDRIQSTADQKKSWGTLIGVDSFDGYVRFYAPNPFAFNVDYTLIGLNHIFSDNDSILPIGYQQVAYVSAAKDVGAYIDLGFSFDTKAVIHISQYIDDGSVTAYPFGAAESSGVFRCMLSSPYSQEVTFYGSRGTSYIGAKVNFVLNDYNNFIANVEKNNFYLINKTNNETSDILDTQTEYTMSNNLYLFAQNYNGTARFGGERRINQFKYYDKNNELICELVPCYRKSDGEIGMYDIVRNTFLTNVGSGTFTKGPDV